MLEGIPLCLFIFYMYIHVYMQIRQNLKKISHVKRKNKEQALRDQREIRKLNT